MRVFRAPENNAGFQNNTPVQMLFIVVAQAFDMKDSKVIEGVYKRTQALVAALSKGLYEREEAMKLALLSAVAGESIFLLGPPGVGKSLIARRLKHAFDDGKSFEYLMSKFSTPDEVFGPVSIRKLRDEDSYARNVDEYMPGASVVFLDEIWKSSPSIQNALLTIINEKVYKNGEQEIRVPIKGLITASNELPPEGESFEPLWDRFLIRYHLDSIRENRNFLKMITDTEDVYEVDIPTDLQISEAELAVWSKEIDTVEVPEEVLSTIQVIRHKIEEYNERHTHRDGLVLTYDRRWKKIIRLLRSSAYLNERTRVDLMDCFLMVHCLWNKPEQLSVIQEIVGESVRKHGYSVAVRLGMLRREMAAFEEEVWREIRVKVTRTAEQLRPYQDEFYEIDKDSSRFEGRYVRLQDYQKMRSDDFAILNVFDEEQNLLNRLQAKKGEEQFTLVIQHNAEELVFRMKTMKVEKEETIRRKAHPMLLKFWDERYQQLHGYLQEQEKRLIDEYPDELNQIEGHLFIDARLAPIVKANHDEVVQALKKLRLGLEKLKFAYDQGEES